MKNKVKLEREKRFDFKGLFNNFFGTQEPENLTPEEVILSDANLSKKEKDELIGVLKKFDHGSFINEVKNTGSKRSRTIIGTNRNIKVKAAERENFTDRERE